MMNLSVAGVRRPPAACVYPTAAAARPTAEFSLPSEALLAAPVGVAVGTFGGADIDAVTGGCRTSGVS